MPEMAEGEMEPAETPETGETGEMPQMSDEDMQGLAQMYRDMRISVDVVVNGSITESDATHVDGNRVTLVDMDFNRILQDSETMERLATQQADSISEVEAMVNDLPGIKAEVKQRIRVRFQ
jgi:L-alanine-DL-glutamate epimerase-like enolase superfamily enzyme